MNAAAVGVITTVVPAVALRMVGTCIAADDALVQTLDVIRGEAFAPKLHTTLPPHFVLESRGIGAAIILVRVSAVFVVRVALTGKAGQQLDALALVLHACRFGLDQHHLLHTHQWDAHGESCVLVVVHAAGRTEFHFQSAHHARRCGSRRGQDAFGVVRIIGQGSHGIVLAHVVNGKVHVALLADVRLGDALVEVVVDALGRTVVGRIAAARRAHLDNHLRTPAAVGIVVQDTGVIAAETHGKHPRTVAVRRVETIGTRKVLVGGQHGVAGHGALGVGLGFRPVFHCQVGAGFQAIDHGEVHFILVGTLVIGQVGFGLVQVGQNLRPHHLVGGTRVAGQGIQRSGLQHQGDGFGLRVYGVALLGKHPRHVHVEHGPHGIGQPHAVVLVRRRLAPGQVQHIVATLDPAVEVGPGILADGVERAEAGAAGIPRGVPFTAAVLQDDVLAHDVAHQEERRITVVIRRLVAGVVDKLARHGVGDGRHEVVEGPWGITGLIDGDAAALRVNHLDAARQRGQTQGCNGSELEYLFHLVVSFH